MNQQSLRTFLLAFTGFAIVFTALPKLPRKLVGWCETLIAAPSSRATVSTDLPKLSAENSYVVHADALAPIGTSRSGVTAVSTEPYLVNPATAIEEASPVPAKASTWERDKIALERLGARSVVLEHRENRYKCHCLMPLAANSPYEKPFFATADEPSQALLKLIEQIQRWQSQRSVRETP
jgi:hypothetical protein